MSEIFVPVTAEAHGDREQILRDLRACGVKRIFLAGGGRQEFANKELRARQIALYRDAVEFYTAEGFECGVWFSSFGYGTSLTSFNREVGRGYTRIRSILGKEVEDALCPTCEAFAEMMEEYVRQIAACGPRLMMLDDELCLSVRPGLGCACERHLELFSERVGEKVTPEGLPQKLFSGAGNRYRSAWFSLMGDTLKEFCARMRRAVDEVDPTIRLGFCAGYTSWDVEGVDAIELSRVLAGKNTKPFLRLTGAPYWGAYGRFGRQTFGTIVEMARMQTAWLRNSDVEFFSEIDSYPRDRFHTPRAYTESFDLALRASENIDHLKYMYEYTCPATYERGYVEEHVRNLPLYREIEALFAGRPAVGVRVYEEMHKLEHATLGEFPKGDYVTTHAYEKRLMQRFSFSDAQKILTPHAIPTVYEGEGLCGIAFGENAKYLPEAALSKGLILDLRAAEILTARGVDVGISEVGERVAPRREEFLDGAAPVSQLYDAAPFYRVTCKEGARVLSRSKGYLFGNAEEEPAVIAYLYENQKGQRFLVYTFAAEEQAESSAFFWSYGRGAQIAGALEWLCGKRLPAVCLRHPQLYAIQKRGENGWALGYVNLHPDAIHGARVELAEAAKTVRGIGCKARRIDERTVEIERIEAFGFAAIQTEDA